MVSHVKNFFKKPAFVKINEKYEISKYPKNANPFYLNKVAEYLTEFDKAFLRAKETSEFQFILSLLRVRGIENIGEDAYENTVNTFHYISKLLKTQKDDDSKLNIFLWIYGHIVEASEPYEIITNLLNIAKGNEFSTCNFPRIKRGKFDYEQYPHDKIAHIESLASGTEFEGIVKILKEVYDRELRNSIFHSNYAVNRGKVFLKGMKFPITYSNKEINEKVNCALAYHEVVNRLYVTHTREYDTTKIIPVSKSFSKLPREKAIIITRENYGIIGMKNSINSPSSWYVGKSHQYERKLMSQGVYTLPPDRIEISNKLLKALPEVVRKNIIGVINSRWVEYEIDAKVIENINDLRNKLKDLYENLSKIYSTEFEKYEKLEVKTVGDKFSYSISFDAVSDEGNLENVIEFAADITEYANYVSLLGNGLRLELETEEITIIKKIAKRDASININEIYTALVAYPTNGEIKYGSDKENMAKINNMAVAISFVAECNGNVYKGLTMIDDALIQLENYTNEVIGKLAAK